MKTKNESKKTSQSKPEKKKKNSIDGKHARLRTSRKKTAKQGMFARWMTFLKEVRIEMKKVTWPPKKEIVSSTTALIIATLLIAFFLGFVDLILAEGIQPALSGKPNVMSFVTVALFGGILVWVFKAD